MLNNFEENQITPEKLPMQVEEWKRKSKDSLTYVSESVNGLVASVSIKNRKVSIGTYIPAGCLIKTAHFETVEDLISCLKNFQAGKTKKNVSFVCSRANGQFNEYVFRLSDHIADFISKKINDQAKSRFPNNEFIFRTGTIFKDKNAPEIDECTIKTIEEISNSVDEETFLNRLLTCNGGLIPPSVVHSMMKNEFGLTDSDGDWWVAGFFISLSSVIFDDDDEDDL